MPKAKRWYVHYRIIEYQDMDGSAYAVDGPNRRSGAMATRAECALFIEALRKREVAEASICFRVIQQ